MTRNDLANCYFEFDGATDEYASEINDIIVSQTIGELTKDVSEADLAWTLAQTDRDMRAALALLAESPIKAQIDAQHGRRTNAFSVATLI